jgi:hypothetical protein
MMGHKRKDVVYMKKAISMILAVMMFLAMVPAFAESAETSAGDGKNGLADLLNGLISELGSEQGNEKAEEVSEALSALKNKLKENLSRAKDDKKISEILDGLADKLSGALTSEEAGGSGLLAKLAEGLGKEGGAGLESLLGALLGSDSGEMTDEEWEKMLEEYYNSPEYQDVLKREAAIQDHILKEYQDTLEAGDVQFICIGSGLDDETEDGGYKYLRYLSLTNFTLDGADLKMKNYAGCPELLVLVKQEDGSYQITEAVRAEDGENYAASITAMSEKYGASIDTVNLNLGEKDWAEAFDLAYFLREHSEYEKAEYQGELRTAEELDAIADAALDAALADVDFSF